MKAVEIVLECEVLKYRDHEWHVYKPHEIDFMKNDLIGIFETKEQAESFAKLHEKTIKI